MEIHPTTEPAPAKECEVLTVCITKAEYDAAPDSYSGVPGGTGICSQGCGTELVYRTDDGVAGTSLCCRPCMTRLIRENGMPQAFAPGPSAVDAFGPELAQRLAMLAGLTSVIDAFKGPEHAAVERAMASTTLKGAVEEVVGSAQDCVDVPVLGTAEHNAFLAGKDAMTACTLSGFKAENHDGGLLAGFTKEQMLAIGEVVIGCEAALARCYGVDSRGKPLKEEDNGEV